jgi:hypothetical protein
VIHTSGSKLGAYEVVPRLYPEANLGSSNAERVGPRSQHLGGGGLEWHLKKSIAEQQARTPQVAKG